MYTLFFFIFLYLVAMRYAITWWTWFLWQQLVHELIKQENQICVIWRSVSKIKKIFWEHVEAKALNELSESDLKWVEVCINLAGAPLLHFPWSDSYKKIIYESRINTTSKLHSVLPKSCHTFISWSAIGYYPDSDRYFNESYINTSASSFLQHVCIKREKEAMKAETSTRRVVIIRTWLVEWAQWFLPVMKKALVLYGWVIPWDWTQWFSTITLDQRIQWVLQCIHNKHIKWPQNFVTHSQSIENYMRNLARSLNRPIRGHVPWWVLHLVLGSFSELFLSSHFITPSTIFDE